MAHKKVFKAQAVRIINKMIDNVLNNPSMIDQGAFPSRNIDVVQGEVCGTPFCAAGHIVFAKNKKLFKKLVEKDNTASSVVDWEEEAAAILKLPSYVCSSGLFGSIYIWPYKFQNMYFRAELLPTKSRRDAGRAKAFAAYWRHILATDGADLL